MILMNQVLVCHYKLQLLWHIQMIEIYNYWLSVFLFLCLGGRLRLLPNFQKGAGGRGGLTYFQILQGVTGKEGVDLFSGGVAVFI